MARNPYTTLLLCGILGVPAVALCLESPGKSEKERDIRLPETDTHLQKVAYYVEEEPEPGYRHASEAAHEAFRDMKYGVRIHWGIYSIWSQPGESWPFLNYSYEKKQEYQELYKKFNPTDFNAEAWMRLFQRVGLKCFAFTSKHHEGFSMFDTKTRVKKRVNWAAPGGPKLEDCDLAYSIMETPFKRDIVNELCDAAHKYGIRIDLYFSHPDWYDPDFRPYNYHPVQTPDAKAHQETYGHAPGKGDFIAPDPTPEETERMLTRHRAQILEILSNYGRIDMMCLDQWMGPTVWPHMRETIRMARKIQPDVMFRCRGIGNYGDYYTPEGFVPGAKENTNMPWMVIYPLGSSFSYDPEARNYKGGPWIVKNLVDTVAKGGNFMVGIGPNEKGTWHPTAVENLEYAGAWLRVNGEAIYGTRPRPGANWKEGDDIRYTQSKDGKTVYAISQKWPGNALELRTVRPLEGSQVLLIGYSEPLQWRYDTAAKRLVVSLPDALQAEENRPCKQAYAFKIAADPTILPGSPVILPQSKEVKAALQNPGEPLEFAARKRVETTPGSGQFKAVEEKIRWDPKKTSLIVCDLWDKHWCKGATARVAEMAPRMNEVVKKLREGGVLIIHCPSETMEFYEGTAPREVMKSVPMIKRKAPPEVKEPRLPIDDSDGGCDDAPQCPQGNPWRRQIATIEMMEGDAITDSFQAYDLMLQRGITSVIIMGVHTNMCVVGRPFGIRNMVGLGQNVMLVRDMTDTMYNSRMAPRVNHFRGTDLVVEHIEKYLCPTITSNQVVGGAPFRFSADPGK